MATLYLTTIIGTGSQTDPFRPAGFDGFPYAVLMNQVSKPGCIVYSPRDDVDVPDQKAVTPMQTRASHADLVAWADSTIPTASERNVLDAWAGSGGLARLPAGSEAWTWAECLHYFARQVNPGASLAALSTIG